MAAAEITKTDTPEKLLQWHMDIGADAALCEEPRNWFESETNELPQKAHVKETAKKIPTNDAPSSKGSKAIARPILASDDEALLSAKEIAGACSSLEDLYSALENFDDCGLKKTAQNLVLYDGNPKARTLLLGEAPGADEDRMGKPFVGRSGKLLDKMIEAIGLSRTSEDRETAVCISNVIFWRPPGNRKPTDQEALLCLPFVEKLIEIIAPDFILCLGATPMHRLVGGNQGIIRARGKWQVYQSQTRSTPLLPTLHPAYLLRAPAQKKHSWQDMLSLKEKLNAR